MPAIKGVYKRTTQERFWEKVIKTDSCWLWIGVRNSGGYGQIIQSGEMVYVHRLAYEWNHGEIPEGQTVDHDCHNKDSRCKGGNTCTHRACVNPAHLIAKTLGDNSNSSPNSRHSKTECIRGHKFDERNTYITPRGLRNCRQCRNAAERRRSEKVKAARR